MKFNQQRQLNQQSQINSNSFFENGGIGLICLLKSDGAKEGGWIGIVFWWVKGAESCARQQAKREDKPNRSTLSLLFF